MEVKFLGIVLSALLATTGSAQAPKPAGGSAQPKPLLASVESRWSDVYCDLMDVSRTSASELTVRYQYRNVRKEMFPLPHVDLVPSTRVFDPTGRTLLGVLKDPAGKPITSPMLDGSLSRPVAAGRTQPHWARLEPPAQGVRLVTVLVEGCLPFENVTIGGTPASPPLTTPAAAFATQDGEVDGLVVEVTRVAHAPGGFLDVTVRYRNGGSAPFTFPNAASPSTMRIGGAYVIDSGSRKKFEVAKDKTAKPLSSETVGFSSSLGETLKPGDALNVWAKFAAPAAATKTVSLYVPQAPPFDNLAISGTGSGPSGGGSAVAGAVVGLDAALKDLSAKVTDAEIRIELAADVLFDFDRAEIKQEAEPSLQKVATVLEAHSRAKVAIEGHTDGRGADDYNQKLSEARAASVKQWLVANAQVNAANISTRGWGKSNPVAHNAKPDGSDDPDGRAKNRRVEIVVRTGG